MCRSTVLTGLGVLVALSATTTSSTLAAQQDTLKVAQEHLVKTPPRQLLSGPRFGVTVFTGEVADQRKKAGLQPLMTQFGWQSETRVVSTKDGSQALLEWIVLLGGVEQSELNLSLAAMAGFRLANGIEFGAGPNMSFSEDSDEPTSSMVLAAGATLSVGELYVPLNLAVAIAEGGPRITALVGWIVG